ncbi:MAG: methyltransferase domain-containing protein [Rivularia sp. T60_A2020_040]|nr:methyltransferase domain-containing protein [Rivularia sp. T60_A2020_040]
MQTPSKESGYSNLDCTSDPMKYVRRLDRQGANPLWQKIKSQMLSLLDVREGDRVLDVGCGTGDDVRSLAQFVGISGSVIGIDSSITMIQEAKRRSEKLSFPVEFYLGDAQNLEFPDNSFNSCRVERVLQHLDNPQQALAQMVRVAKSGARIVIVEPDYGTISIDGGHSVITRKLIARRCSHFRNGRIGILLPLLYKHVGLKNIVVELTQVVRTNIDEEHEQFLLDKYIEPAIAVGVISASEGKQWIEDLKQADLMGSYRYAFNLFLVCGYKPNS